MKTNVTKYSLAQFEPDAYSIARHTSNGTSLTKKWTFVLYLYLQVKTITNFNSCIQFVLNQRHIFIKGNCLELGNRKNIGSPREFAFSNSVF